MGKGGNSKENFYFRQQSPAREVRRFTAWECRYWNRRMRPMQIAQQWNPARNMETNHKFGVGRYLYRLCGLPFSPNDDKCHPAKLQFESQIRFDTICWSTVWKLMWCEGGNVNKSKRNGATMVASWDRVKTSFLPWSFMGGATGHLSFFKVIFGQLLVVSSINFHFMCELLQHQKMWPDLWTRPIKFLTIPGNFLFTLLCKSMKLILNYHI